MNSKLFNRPKTSPNKIMFYKNNSPQDLFKMTLTLLQSNPSNNGKESRIFLAWQIWPNGFLPFTAQPPYMSLINVFSINRNNTYKN